MEINFVKLNPTQNMTILVETEVPREEHGAVAQRLMAYEGVYAEQVGFIEPPENKAAWARLQMMGGEFCGNATMSLAAFWAIETQTKEGRAEDLLLEVSGLTAPIKVTANRNGRAARCSLEMPGPENIERQKFPFSGAEYPVTVVTMAGIIHLILDMNLCPGDKSKFAELALREWKKSLNTDAIGLILYDRVRNFIQPLIYVQPTGSMVWERGCASGTAALGAALAHQAQGSLGADIAQPGGVISVLSDYVSGRVAHSRISGQVKMVARGVAYL